MSTGQSAGESDQRARIPRESVAEQPARELTQEELTHQREEVVLRLMELSRLMVAIAARTIVAIDSEVSMPQYRLLVVIDLGGPQRVSDLAAELGVHPSTAGRMVERLVAKGLIRRQAGSDRRETIVRLTAQGTRFTQQATVTRRQKFIDLINHLDPSDLAGVRESLELLGQAGADLGLTYLGDADSTLPW